MHGEHFVHEFDLCSTAIDTETGTILVESNFAPLSLLGSFNILIENEKKGPVIFGDFKAGHVPWGDDFCATYGQSLFIFCDDISFMLSPQLDTILSKCI